MKRLQSLAIVVAGCALTACGGGGSSSGGGSVTPNAVQSTVAGTYNGSANDAKAGSGSISFTLTQSGNSLSGQLYITFANGAAENNNGTLAGTISGTSIHATFTPNSSGICGYTIDGTVNSATDISGKYTTINCNVTDSGSFAATKP